MTHDGPGRKLKTVETAIRILNLLTSEGEMTARELANHLEMAKSTVHGYMKTLETHNYVHKEGRGYRVGAEMLSVGGTVRERYPEYRLAIQMVDEISNDTEERAQFIIEEDGRGVVVHTSTGSKGVQVNSRIGKRSHLHASSAGKVILAWERDDVIDRVIDRWGLPGLTENTITTREELLPELEQIRELGFATNREESITGLHAVGVPLKRDDVMIGAVSVSGPSHRLRGASLNTEIPDYLRGMANEFSLRVSHSVPRRDSSELVDSRW